MMQNRIAYNPNMILPIGTQVVTRVAAAGRVAGSAVLEIVHHRFWRQSHVAVS